MKAGAENLAMVFDKNHRYLIPIFQRPYVWDADGNWAPLWDDIRKVAEEAEREGYQDRPREHFLGALVTQHQPPVPRRITGSYVIDGQQRLTTLQVFLAAARRVAYAAGAPTAGDRFGALISNRVPTGTEHPDDCYKVVPLRTDEAAFRWAVRDIDEAIIAPDSTHRLVMASVWFEKAIGEWLSQAEDVVNRLDQLHFVVVNQFMFVSVFLDAQDDPQVIFESLNHKGVRLDVADLVKNALFQLVDQQGDRSHQEPLHEEHWKPLDGKAWRTEVVTGRIKRARVDVLLAYWLSVQRGEESSVEHLFQEVKAWLKNSESRAAHVIKDIRRYADTMEMLYSRPLTDPVGQVVDRLEANRTTTPWPLMLYLHANPAIPEPEARRGTVALDSFIMRRSICRMETKDYNRLFAAALAAVKATDPERAGEGLEEFLLSQTAPTRLWPTDIMFMEALTSDDIYNRVPRPRLRSLLVGIDNALLGTKAEDDPPRSARSSLSIEHVLPQTWQKHWPLSLKFDEAQCNTYVHQLGNLTLTRKALNSSLSNGPWLPKRQALQKFSVMRITTASILTVPESVQGFTQDEWTDQWDEDRIALRGLCLVRLAIGAWARPQARTT